MESGALNSPEDVTERIPVLFRKLSLKQQRNISHKNTYTNTRISLEMENIEREGGKKNNAVSVTHCGPLAWRCYRHFKIAHDAEAGLPPPEKIAVLNCRSANR